MFRIKPFHVLLAIFATCVASCTKNDTVFTIGDNLINIKSNVITVDTSTVNTYTVKFDSIVTSKSILSSEPSYALIGRYTDGAFGTITASSFLQIGLSTSWTLDENAKYDSISLVLKPTTWVHGDTTKPWTLQVHKLNEDLINTEQTYRYSTSKIGYSPIILGSRTFKRKLKTTDKVFIPLSDSFGKALFRMAYYKSDTFKTQTEFNRYFKGIALTIDTTTAQAIYRFDVSSDSVTFIRVHYHVGPDTKTMDFKLINGSYQFNHIESDYSNSPLKVLKKQREMISSKNTNNESYVQAGMGIMTRIEFPNLKAIQMPYQNFKILKAELIVKPVSNTYGLIPLPYPMYLYYTDDLNDMLNPLTTTNSSSAPTVVPTLVRDMMFNDQTSYTFDITYTINYMLKNLTDSPPSLLLSIPASYVRYSTDRLIIGNQQHPTNNIKLKITYWKY